MEDEIVNKVASSGLITINLEDFFPKEERVTIDIKSQLWEGIVLKEKDFRSFIKNTDWSLYSNKHVAITCSEDVVIPTWAFMLLSVALNPFAKTIHFGTLESLEEILFDKALEKINPKEYTNERIIIKGCSSKKVPVSAYIKLTTLLQPYVKNMMYGEPCSTVPLYKKA